MFLYSGKDGFFSAVNSWTANNTLSEIENLLVPYDVDAFSIGM